MSDEIFDGVVAEDLSLAEAIVRRILPAPDYVSALYTLNEEIDDLLTILEKSKKSKDEKNEIAAEINQAKLDWENTSGIPEILKKHLKPDINKFLIFCKDQDHLDKMEVEVQRWFQRAGIHRFRKVYRVISADPKSDQNLEDFKNAQASDTVHILFSIDMLNEGLHISDVGAVILLRPTESPRVFYQQIGRCIQVNVEHTPIIFDLVNNFQSIRASDIFEDIKKANERECNRRANLGLKEYSPEIHITDETKKILEVFEAISERLSSWEIMLHHLCKYAVREGHARVPHGFITSDGFKLGSWTSTRRSEYKQNKLSKDRIKALEEVPGWTWDPREEQWNEGYEQLKKYVISKGHARVPDIFITPDGLKLRSWINTRRREYKQNKLSKDRIKALEEVPGWTWDPREEQWNEGYEQLKKYVTREGHARVPHVFITSDGFKLGTWVDNKRRYYKQKKLSESRIKTLEQIGFEWRIK